MEEHKNNKKIFFITVIAVFLAVDVLLVAMKLTSKKVVLNLPENPTTGCTWSFSCEEDGFKLLSSKYFPDKSEKGMVGTGGTRRFIFKVSSDTQFDVMFYNCHSWEPLPENPDIIYVYKPQAKALVPDYVRMGNRI